MLIPINYVIPADNESYWNLARQFECPAILRNLRSKTTLGFYGFTILVQYTCQ